MIIIKNALLANMADIDREIVDIAIDDGKIVKIGKIDGGDHTIIDAGGRLVTPGLIDAHCHIGMMEDGNAWAGDDVNEMTDPVVPQVRAIDAIKPQDIAFREALEAGFTTVVTGPGSGEVIGGTFCVLKTHGKTIWDKTVIQEACMKMALGENPKRCFGTKGKMPSTRMGTAAVLREQLTKASKYHDEKKAFLAGEEGAKEPTYSASLDSLARVFDGMICKIHAHQQDDIVTAIRIAEEFGLKYTIDHCTEGYLVADELVEHNCGVIIGPTLGARSKIELRNKTFDSGKILQDKGIPFALMTDHPVIPLSQALVQAGIFVKHGVTHTNILKALSINAAKLAGIDHLVGSIEVGKHADIVIWSGDPLHYMTVADLVMVNGEVVHSR